MKCPHPYVFLHLLYTVIRLCITVLITRPARLAGLIIIPVFCWLVMTGEAVPTLGSVLFSLENTWHNAPPGHLMWEACDFHIGPEPTRSATMTVEWSICRQTAVPFATVASHAVHGFIAIWSILVILNMTLMIVTWLFGLFINGHAAHRHPLVCYGTNVIDVHSPDLEVNAK